MKTPAPPPGGSRLFRRLALTALAALTISTAEMTYSAETRYNPMTATPGGLSPTPDITSMVLSNNQLRIDWGGLGAGPFSLERRYTLGSGRWDAMGNPGDAHSLTLPATNQSSIFRVSAPAPFYTGADTCLECHADHYSDWSQTIHAGALETLKNIHVDKNQDCLKCHTVGLGFDSGFKDSVSTPYFGGVQCENCHGPAGDHASNPLKKELRPKISYSANVCGGCHSDDHHPTLEEWSETLHAKVDPHVQSYFLDPNPTNSVARMNSCGACHSGAVRLQMLRSTITGLPPALPGGQEAAQTGITCEVCHDAHKPNIDGGFGLRNPTSSTDFFSYNTAATTTFAKQYNENIQMCGQCHNMRGATPDDTSRPPHHSPQYNMLIGDIGADKGYVAKKMPVEHTKLDGQCAYCHMHAESPATPTADNPADTGHAFEPNKNACVECHESVENTQFRIVTTQNDTKKRIQELKNLLDQWAQTKAPDALRTKYGKLAWEYTAAGELSNPTGSATIAGPSTADQAKVSGDIKKARMYLYLVQNDGSLGVHNGPYARYLLGTAKTNVLNLLNAQ